MKLFNKETINRSILIYSTVLAIFIIYPNITSYLWYVYFGYDLENFYFFIFRYLYFVSLFWTLLTWNLKKTTTTRLAKRIGISFVIAAIAYGIYVVVSLFVFKIHGDHFTVNLVFQYIVAMTVSAGIGQVFIINQEKRAKEMEIEQLKLETLQSRYEALTNQINPHFFFNALNSLTGLIRNQEKNITLKFVDKLSDVFRYILKSDKKGLVSLNEELEFMKSYQYLMEIRFAKKLSFTSNIADDILEMRLPVLSLLPLIENVVQHNTIDSENKMKVILSVSNNNELIVSNIINPKLEGSVSNNTGLVNLDSRFWLLTRKKIKVVNADGFFSVSLPLVSAEEENNSTE